MMRTHGFKIRRPLGRRQQQQGDEHPAAYHRNRTSPVALHAAACTDLIRLTSMVRLIHAFTLLPPSGVVLCAESTWRHENAGCFNIPMNSVKVAFAVGVGSGICEPVAQGVDAWMSTTP